ncbi:PC4 and SFRS1-interacting protein-like isoform X3 [Hetaerina americana]|uniref:PC4 and SFRS1-interacting protein-like isoform X3 n=1 Tax=Hetaerina americana TaxID=62018 RepID=UPI003A7F2A72
MAKRICRGELVFAKIRGYPAWPARVEAIPEHAGGTKTKKYKVYFFGTKDRGMCTSSDLFPYLENKERYGKQRSGIKGFNQALTEIEACSAINSKKTQGEKAPQPKAPAAGVTVASTVSRTKNTSGKESLVVERGSAGPSTDHDAERAMDSGEKEGGDVVQSNEPVRKMRCGSSASVPGQPKPTPLVDKTPSKSEKVSRSGRVIKRKRFPDEEGGGAMPVLDPVGTKANEEEPLVPPTTSEGKPVDPMCIDEVPDLLRGSSSDEQGDILMEEKKRKCDDPTGGDLMATKGVKPTVHADDKGIQSKQPQSADVNGESSGNLSTLMTTQIEGGLPEHVKERMGFLTMLKCELKPEVWKLLQTECQMMELNAHIRMNLSFKSVDFEKAYMYMDRMNELDISAIMLKKNPVVVETFKVLRFYVGNYLEWDTFNRGKAYFLKRTAIVREKAQKLFTKFETLFSVPDGKPFVKEFLEQVEAFDKATEHLTKEKRFAIVDDPPTVIDDVVASEHLEVVKGGVKRTKNAKDEQGVNVSVPEKQGHQCDTGGLSGSHGSTLSESSRAIVIQKDRHLTSDEQRRGTPQRKRRARKHLCCESHK